MWITTCIFVFAEQHKSQTQEKLLHPLKHPAYLPFHCRPLLRCHEKHPIPAVPLNELSQ